MLLVVWKYEIQCCGLASEMTMIDGLIMVQ